jgi:hypothetical protein
MTKMMFRPNLKPFDYFRKTPSRRGDWPVAPMIYRVKKPRLRDSSLASLTQNDKLEDVMLSHVM